MKHLSPKVYVLRKCPFEDPLCVFKGDGFGFANQYDHVEVESLNIPGLIYLPDFVTDEEQRKIIKGIDSHPFSHVIRRRQQHYGDVYYHTTHDLTVIQPVQEHKQQQHSEEPLASKKLVSSYAVNQVSDEQVAPKEITNDDVAIQQVATNTMIRSGNFKDVEAAAQNGFSLITPHGHVLIPPKSLPFREIEWLVDRIMMHPSYRYLSIFHQDNYPTQALVNEYRFDMGIASHFDDENAFGDVIMTVSLGHPVILTLKKPQHSSNDCNHIVDMIKILLEPKSCFVMSQDARFKWRHGITKARIIVCPDQSVLLRDENYRRISITIRKLLDGRKQALKNTRGPRFQEESAPP